MHLSFTSSGRFSQDNLLSLDQQTIEKIVSYIVTKQASDHPAFAAIRLTCRKLRISADSCKVWEDIPLVYPDGNIRLHAFSLIRKPDTAGTEGFCMKVASKATKALFALKKARPFSSEGVPYYLVREISTLRTLVHHNVVPLLGVSVKANTLYMLFPYVQYTLQHVLMFRPDGTRHLQAATPLQRKHALHLTAQLVDALAYCHSKGVLHRNVKPKHILLQMEEEMGSEGTNEFNLQRAHLYLSDFALMRAVTKPKKPLTAEMTSLWYRPPEILMGTRTYTEALDVWSLGCVFAEMLSGSPLFTGMSQVEQLFQIFSKLGTPTAASWPAFSNQPYFCDTVFPEWDTPGSSELSLGRFFPGISSAELDLLERCLRCCPEKRASAAQLQTHPALLPYRSFIKYETAPSTGGGNPGTATGLNINAGSLRWHLDEVKMSLPAYRVNSYVQERALQWTQVSSMLTRELEMRSKLCKTFHTRSHCQCRYYRNVILYLTNLHQVADSQHSSRAAGKCSSRSLHLAVDILDRYLNQLVQQQHNKNTTSLFENQPIRDGKVLKDPCLCRLLGWQPCDNHPTTAVAAPGSASKLLAAKVGFDQHVVHNPLLSFGISCLQLASKYEDFSYLDAAEVLSLSAQVTKLVRKQLDEMSGATPSAAPTTVSIKAEIICEGGDTAVLENSVAKEEGEGEVELTEEARLYMACAQLSVEDVARAEQQVLQALRFDICGPTVVDFVGFYCEECYRLMALSLGWCSSHPTSASAAVTPTTGLFRSSPFPVLVVKEADRPKEESSQEGGELVASPLQRALGVDLFLFPHLPFLEELTSHLCWLTLFSSSSLQEEEYPPSLQAAAIVTLSVNLLLSLAYPTEDDDSNAAAAVIAFSSSVSPPAREASPHQKQQQHVQLQSALQRAVHCWSSYCPRELTACQLALCSAMSDNPCPVLCTFKVPALGVGAVNLSLGDVISMVNGTMLKKSIFSKYV